jgi:hypothetical protein
MASDRAPLDSTLGRMITLPSTFPILVVKQVGREAFVEYWSSQYPLVNEPVYQANVGKPLTAERVWALFEWKNDGTIAKHKRESIQANYIDVKPTPPRAGDRDDLVKFVLMPGGVIWRIFWLHCHDPHQYPIFDQHVYRAMRQLLHGRAEEPPTTNRGKAIAYADEYMPFHKAFKHSNGKLLDQALWSYGKYLKGKNAA